MLINQFYIASKSATAKRVHHETGGEYAFSACLEKEDSVAVYWLKQGK